MAVLAGEQLAQIRKKMARKAKAQGVPIAWLKPVANAAAQAIKDVLDGDSLLQQSEVDPAGTGFPAIMSVRIDAATAPWGITLSNAAKKWIFAYVCFEKFGEDG